MQDRTLGTHFTIVVGLRTKKVGGEKVRGIFKIPPVVGKNPTHIPSTLTCTIECPDIRTKTLNNLYI